MSLADTVRSDVNPRSFPKITDEGLVVLRRRIGANISESVEPWSYEATRDNIRHFAHGIRDDSPLYCDPACARGSPFGGVIAPPSFPFACNRFINGYCGGLPGVHAMWAGAEWTWHKSIRRNDVVRAEAYLKGPVEHQTRFAGRVIQQIYHVDLCNQTDDRLAEAESSVFRTKRDAARESGSKYSAGRRTGTRICTDAELSEIYSCCAKTQVRGPATRYFEDGEIVDEISTIVRGPKTVTGFIAYAQGWGALYVRANKLQWKLIEKQSGTGIKNRFGIPNCLERVHREEAFDHEVGASSADEYGPARTSWMIHHLTNWASDDDFVRASKTHVRRHNPEGDVLYITWNVTGKEIVHNAPAVFDKENIFGVSTITTSLIMIVIVRIGGVDNVQGKLAHDDCIHLRAGCISDFGGDPYGARRCVG